jgi:hypothetical protein
MDDIATRKQNLETRKQILHALVACPGSAKAAVVQPRPPRQLHVQVQLRLQYNIFNNFFNYTVYFQPHRGESGHDQEVHTEFCMQKCTEIREISQSKCRKISPIFVYCTKNFRIPPEVKKHFRGHPNCYTVSCD